jgi:GT2 family glycosyltransferase
MKVEIGFGTRDRYECLALCLWGLLEQTYKDFVVTIIDDSDNVKDVRDIPYLSPILKRLDQEGHCWRLFYGQKKGPQQAFQIILDNSRAPYVLIIDDDSVMDSKCLEYMVEGFKTKANENVAAIGPIVINPSVDPRLRTLPRGYKWIKQFNGFTDEHGKCPGDHHWRYHQDNELMETDHFQCFLMDAQKVKNVGGFDQNYNVTGFRGETDLCLTLYRSGYKLYLQPKSIIWHLQVPSGGTRGNFLQLFQEAHEYYIDKFGFKRGRYKDKVIKIEGGLGDHLCATPLLRELKKKGKVIVSAVYPHIFVGNPNVDELIFRSEEINYQNVDKRSVFAWAGPRAFEGKLSEAWCNAYSENYDGDKLDYTILPEEREWATKEVSDASFIVIAPYSAIPVIQYHGIEQTEASAKITVIRDWYDERWTQLIKEIQKLGIKVYQVGGQSEKCIDGIDKSYIGIDYRLTIALLERSETFIGVDSFLQHAGHAIGKKGVVLFGAADPSTTGHDSNINIKKHKCDQDLMCMKQSYPISQWTFKSKDCPSRLCMDCITVEDVLSAVKEIIDE